MQIWQVSSIVIAALAPLASGQFFEGFEHGNWSENYTHLSSSTSPNLLDASSARTGAFGVTYVAGGWWQHSSPDAAIEDGTVFEYYARGSGGRVYIGFTSDTAGSQAYTVVAAPNTGNLLIQRNNGFGFSDIATSTPISWSASEFYQVLVTYEGGVITAEVFDSSGAALAAPIMADTGYSGGGRLLMRGFSNMQADDIDLAAGSENALVLDGGSMAGVGAAATEQARLFPLVTTTEADFAAALPTVAWRMVTIDNPSLTFSAATSDAIAAYIAGGGRVHMSYWNLDADPTLQEAFGIASATDFFDPRPVFERGGHPSWGGLTTVPVGSQPSPWGDNGDTLTVDQDCSGGAPNVVGDFDSSGSGEGAIVTAGGRTLVNGFDYDSMDPAAVSDLVANQINWLRSAEPGPGFGPTGCIGDCNGDGTLDFFDFLCFQNNFSVENCEADCDRNGELDFFDFLCFQNEFATGCPDLAIVQYSVEPPPTVECGTTVTAFQTDPRPLATTVTTAPSPLGGDLSFDIALVHRRIGAGWPGWSHGYEGDVYDTQGRSLVTVGVPENSAFYLYVQPNPFSLIEFEVIGEARGVEVSAIDSIHGDAGARGFGFCGGVEHVTVRTTDGFTDFAIGEFGIAN